MLVLLFFFLIRQRGRVLRRLSPPNLEEDFHKSGVYLVPSRKVAWLDTLEHKSAHNPLQFPKETSKTSSKHVTLTQLSVKSEIQYGRLPVLFLRHRHS